MALLSPPPEAATPADGLGHTERAFWRAWLQATQSLTDRLDRELNDDFGITIADYEAMAHLAADPDGRLRMSELADLALVSRSRLTYRINRLEESGLVRREPCESDKRGYFAVLTERGAAVLAQAQPVHVAGVRAGLLDQVPAEVADTLLAVLDRIAAASR
ncbi:MAG: MarR family transcriptional regulator [Microthrixaceae bacterium]